MAIVKDLGMVTAYAYAVAGGYVGTEAEFTELLGQAGVTLEQLENLSAVAVTLAPGSEATASYSDGVLTFGIPQGAKGDKGDKGDKGNKGDTGDTGNGISSITKTGTSGLVDTYTITFTDGTTTTFTVTNGADGVIANVAQAFDATKAYSVGDMVLYQGTLYAFTAAHAAGAWVGSDAQAVILSDVVADLKSELSDIVETYKPRNLYDHSKAEVNKYLNPNGTMETYNGRYVTDFIEAIPGKYIVCSYIAGSNNTLTRTDYAAICCYDANKNVVAGGNYNKTSFLVPDGVSYVRVTVSGTLYVETAMIENSDTDMPTVFEFYHAPTQFINKDISVYPKNMGFLTIRGDLEDGESLYLSEHNVKNDNVLSFTANITTFNSLQIGKGADAVITIDDTNIIIHSDQGNFTEAHGLTIENNIQVLITNKTDVNADVVRITSNGISHTVTGTHRFIMDEGKPFVTSAGSTLTDAVFSWTSRNINKPIWLFGDSYFSWYDSRWTYYLAQDGYTKSCMLNGFAGETVLGAMAALRSLLTVRTPNIVVWCMGMNNPDENTAVSPLWKNAYNELVSLSKSYGFELILATIPNTPTINNSFKNDIVINSGYRYIDFAKAVNIPGTSNWYSGMLAGDNVHPTAKGAVSLYGQVLADFPEITSM